MKAAPRPGAPAAAPGSAAPPMRGTADKSACTGSRWVWPVCTPATATAAPRRCAGVPDGSRPSQGVGGRGRARLSARRAALPRPRGPAPTPGATAGRSRQIGGDSRRRCWSAAPRWRRSSEYCRPARERAEGFQRFGAWTTSRPASESAPRKGTYLGKTRRSTSSSVAQFGRAGGRHPGHRYPTSSERPVRARVKRRPDIK